jgi:hypothetical protein
MIFLFGRLRGRRGVHQAGLFFAEPRRFNSNYAQDYYKNEAEEYLAKVKRSPSKVDPDKCPVVVGLFLVSSLFYIHITILRIL